MQKSIASRFFSATSLLIVTSIGAVGIILMIFANRYFKTERLNLMDLCIDSAVETINKSHINDLSTMEDRSSLREKLRLISSTTNTDIFVADRYGRVIICTEGDICIHADASIPRNVLSPADNTDKSVQVSEYFRVPSQGNYYTIARALKNTVEGDTALKGYVFATSDANSILIFTNALLYMFMLSAGVMILVSSVVSLAVTSKLTTPLRNISDAAKSFSQGDFSARAAVEGDDEVAHLAYTFNAMASFAQNNETSRSNFVTNIAHELRTPMTSIKGFVDGIIDGTIAPDQQKKYLTIVSEEIGRLARLTNSMLNISKLDSGEFVMNVEQYNIWDTITAVAFAFENRIENANISIKGFEPQRINVIADKDIIHQVVYNIVDNALKFTPDNGYIGFTVLEEKSSNSVIIKIKNSGAGIRAEALPYVFERFYKADASRSVHTKGAGIGLYIAKTLVQRSGGEIFVESQEGAYTEFIFTLPSGNNEKAKNSEKNKNSERNKSSDKNKTGEKQTKSEKNKK